MANREAASTTTSSKKNCSERYSSQALRQIGAQIETLLGWHSTLEMYRRSVDRQLTLLATRLHMDDVPLLPRNVFLQVEMRGCGGLSAPLEQIARVLAEVGYWKPSWYVQGYYSRDVYHLGRSAQRLFDDYAKLDGRVWQLYAHLSYIRDDLPMRPQATPQEVFEGVAVASAVDRAKIRARVDAIVDLLEQPSVGRRLIVATRRFIGLRSHESR